MIETYKIIDDAIPKKYQDDIEDLLLGNNSFPWYYVDDVTLTKDKIDKFATKALCPAFNHVFWNDQNPYANDAWWPFIKPLAYTAYDKVNIEVTEILQARSFLQLPIAKETPENHPHFDLPFDHLVCLYYVNDNEGPTVLYNETNKEYTLDQINDIKFTEMTKVYPKKGRALLFNGKYFHASSTPNQRSRCIINFDLFGESKI